MSGFDTFNFSARIKPFPAGLSRVGWQTKSLNCRQVEYRVDASGRVGRRLAGDPEFYYSNTASFSAFCTFYVKGERYGLTLVVVKGRLAALEQEGVDDEPALHDKGWDISESEILDEQHDA